MPYSSVSELPAGVKKKYTSKQQRVFQSAFNSAVKQGKSEAQAFKIAHQAAQKAGKANDEARNVSTKERKKLANKGKAMKGGGFPIANKQDLKNAIQAYGRASNKAAAKRHIIKRAKALGATNLLPDSWKKGDSAMARVPCPDCDREFLDGASLVEHAESVHTFSEKRSLVSRAVRQVHGKDCMLVDLSDDWMIYDAYDSQQGRYVLYKQPYSIDSSGKVTISGESTEVMRKIAYVPSPKIESASATLASLDIALKAAKAGVPPSDDFHDFAQEEPAPNPMTCTDCGRHKAHPLHHNGYPAVADKASAGDETAASQRTIEIDASASVECKICGEKLENPVALKMHMKKKHKGDEDKDVKSK